MSLSFGIAEGMMLMQGDVLGALKVWARREILDKGPGLLTFTENVPGPGTAIEASFPWEGHYEGYVAQGIAVKGDQVLYATYPKEGYAPENAVSKVEVHDRTSHEKIARFELPKEIKHAGGMTIDNGGNLLVADTHAIYKIDLKRAIKEGHCENAVLGKHRMDGINGSSIAYDSKTDRILIVQFNKITGTEGYFFDAKQVFAESSDHVLSAKEAVVSLKLPYQVQGAAWDAQGNLWLSRSNLWTKGDVCRIDEISGHILERHQLVAGLQDIEFDKDEKLWTLSEAGARPYEWMMVGEQAKVFQINVNHLEGRTFADASACSLASSTTDEAVGSYAQKVVDAYAEKTGLNRIDVVVTRNVANASADAGFTWIKGDETIYINPDFARRYCDSPDTLAGVVLHEAGHAYAQSAGYTEAVANNYASEFQADIVAAQAMDSLGFDRMEFAKLVKTFGAGSDTHPSGYARYTVIKTAPTAHT